MKRVAIVQSNYIPWKGYFDLMASVDEFIVYDDVQYTHNDWRNRNRIKTPQGVQWLTVPVKQTGRFQQSIRQAEIAGHHWQQSHWKTLQLNYQRAACFARYAAELEALYVRSAYTHLSTLNHVLLTWCMRQLDINTHLTDSADYTLVGDKTMRLVHLCEQAGASEYLSGPAAKSYLDETAFLDRGIKVTWFEYGSYPAYPQLWGEFEHRVSVLDLLFNTGDKAKDYLRGNTSSN